MRVPGLCWAPQAQAYYGAIKSGREVFIGDEAEAHRGIMKLDYPMTHGIVENWADMEKVWTYVYGKTKLGVNSEEHPVLLTEAPLNPRQNQEQAAEVFFETFGVPALFVSPQATLSLTHPAAPPGWCLMVVTV